jgi:hypothetical protein
VILGSRSIKARAYCSWYNFNGGDQQKKVGDLSGGERNRLQLAKVRIRDSWCTHTHELWQAEPPCFLCGMQTLKIGGNVLLLDGEDPFSPAMRSSAYLGLHAIGRAQ